MSDVLCVSCRQCLVMLWPCLRRTAGEPSLMFVVCGRLLCGVVLRLTVVLLNELDALASVHAEAITNLVHLTDILIYSMFSHLILWFLCITQDVDGTNSSVTSLYLEVFLAVCCCVCGCCCCCCSCLLLRYIFVHV